MSKELPYFRFTSFEWLNDDISLEDYETKGVFIDICAYYWFKDCSITKAMLEKRFSNAISVIKRLFDSGIIKFKNGDDYIDISFLNKQFDQLSELRRARQDAWNTIKSWWGGKSPSKLGMSVVQGIKSVGHLIYAALTAPFTMALGWIRKHIPGASMLLGKGDTNKTVRKPVVSRAMAAYIPAVTVSPSGTKIEGSSTPKPAKASGDKKSSATLDDVLDALVTQNKLLEKILAKDPSIKMDGQLLSTSLARQTEFKGGYGVNKV